METTVVNLNDYVAPQFGGGLLVRIDRTTKWGNPFRVGTDGDRAAVIEKYRRWLWRKIQNEEVDLYQLADLHGCELGCHCHPLPCHGDVLARAAAWAADYLGDMPDEVKRDDLGYALPQYDYPLA